MKEVEEILRLWKNAEASGESAVLATVVKTRGSSYRVPGARMLLTRSGQRAGSISGGCLEDELIKKAFWFTESGPVIRRYDTTPDGEIASGFGLGCSGVIHVLLERLTPRNPTVLSVIQATASERVPAAIAHVIQPIKFAGQRLTIDAHGIADHNVADAELASSLERENKVLLSERVSRTVLLKDDI